MATDFLLIRKIHNFGRILWPQERHRYTSEILAEVAAKTPDIINTILCYLNFIFFFFLTKSMCPVVKQLKRVLINRAWGSNGNK